jgi:hypothetical protein
MFGPYSVQLVRAMYNRSVHNHAAVQARDRRCFAISVIESQHVQMAFEQCEVGDSEQLAVVCDGEGKGDGGR